MSSLVAWFGALLALGVIGVPIVELLARWWLRRQGAYYVWPPGYRRVLRTDHKAVPAAEPLVHFEINSAGERGDEWPRRAESVYRVLTAGGSSVESMLVDQTTSWPGAMQQILSRPENLAALGVARVHVGNVGKSEVDSGALARLLRLILPRYPRLDAIILFVGASDMIRWLTIGAPAGKAEKPLPDTELFAWHPRGPFTSSPKRTALAELARRLRLRLLRPIDYRERAGKFMTNTRAMRARAMPLCTFVGDPSGMLDAYATSLREALVTAAAQSDQVVLARQPWFDKDQYTPEEESQFWHGALGDVTAGEVKQFCSSQVIRELMSAIDQRAAQVAEELGIVHVDLRAVVESSLADYYDHFHFTPAGSVKVAEALADVLLRGARSGAASSLSDYSTVR